MIISDLLFFVANFNLQTYESDKFTLHFYVDLFYIDIISNQDNCMKHFYITLTVPCEKFKSVSFSSARMKSVVLFSDIGFK